ncbi:MBL fold metallo-hydrolase [Sorangium sp. So ce1078]|uniref:MBL fold metallo-hydrolase n=1 Tax=Sorangium sp. So ce1078 TaxID=3133329 RepID=UPI003F64613B
MIRPRSIAAGVEAFAARTPTLPPATHTNSYALGGREVLLVEPATPYEDERREWLAWARGLASGGRAIVAIAVTHHHADHVGGARFFAAELGVPVWAHAEAAPRLRGVPVARHLADGEVVRLDGPTPTALRVLHTPGHAPDHLCFLDEAHGALVCGDMVAGVGTILIDPREGDMAEYLAQLERLAALGARVVLPAHGEPIDAPEELFRRYVAHRRMREQRVLEALEAAGEGGAAGEAGKGSAAGNGGAAGAAGKGSAAGAAGASLEALLPIAYADTAPHLWPLARLSLEAHLIKLEREGRAVRRDGRWRRAAADDA